MFSQIATSVAAISILSLGTPPLEIAQASDRYANWIYLYEDSFQTSAGEQITQAWWLNPDVIRRNTFIEFSLLARRTPVSSNGTAAAVFDYIADCGAMSHALKKTTLLDSSDAVIDTQTNHRPMAPTNPEEPFHEVLQDLCGGIY
jgi:hypothetical protein